METLFVTVLAVLLAVTVGCCIVTVKKKSEYSAVIRRLLHSGIVGMVCYILFLLSDNLTMALFFDGMYFVCTDWMLLCLLAYVLRYGDINIKTKLYRNVLVAYAIFDTLCILFNVRSQRMFTLEQAVHEGTGLLYWSATLHKIHYWHLGFCYILTLLVLAVLIKKTAQVSKMYKKMYLYTLVLFVILIAVNAVCYISDFPLDFSLLLYAVLAIIVCYNSLYAVPKGLMEDTLISVVEDFNSGIFCFDIKGKFVYANAKAYEFLQAKEGETIPFEQYFRKWKEQNPREVADYDEWEEQYTIEGTERSFHAEFQRVKDKKNVTTGYSFKLTDRTEEIRRFREEQYLATHDRLTGLYNREYFFQKAEQIIKRNPEVERYMVCTNIKNFKLINDLFGEEMGDRVLVDQASMLKFANYEDCIHGRIGPDRFAMLVAKENFNQELAEKNTGRLQYLINDANYKIQVCIGVYKIEDPTESPQVMYDKANMAIEAPQEGYHKTVVYYDAKMLERLMQEKTVVGEFDRAIREKQFVMYLQPLVGADGRLIGAEALARWHHPSQGLIMPVNFISIIEKAGLIIRLDEYIWELAAEKLSQWKAQGMEDLSISVNVSAKDFYYTDLSRVFIGLAEKYDISPGNLNIEITETVLVTDLMVHLQTLEKLRDYGFRIEIDDFGSGYSSLNMLKDVKADILKIDMLFLRETENRDRSRVILNSIVNMAKNLDMLVLVEGVETAEQLETLRRMGCDIFQGFYFSKPVPVEEFEEKYF